MKIKTPTRANFSRSARLCDQNLYHESSPSSKIPLNYQSPKKKIQSNKLQNFYFKSVSREKRGNFRFSVKATKGQFLYKPDFNYVKKRNPGWLFPKEEKYQNQKFQEYQLCHKHPLIKQNQQAKMKATDSMKDIHQDKVKMKKSSSMMSTQIDFSRNYSIIQGRDTSPSGFFNKTKIQTARYLDKQDLNAIEADEDSKKYDKMMKTSQKLFIDYKRQKVREPNVNRKSFQSFNKTYSHQKQFQNFSMTKYPISPSHHIKMQSHLSRPSFYPSRLGPNPQILPIQYTRPCQSNINLNLSTFRSSIKTRYDRIQPEPNTRLDVQLERQRNLGCVEMNRMIARQKQFFPIVDYAIKKQGDSQIKRQLKQHIPRIDLNQAHKYVNPDVQIKHDLIKK